METVTESFFLEAISNEVAETLADGWEDSSKSHAAEYIPPAEVPDADTGRLSGIAEPEHMLVQQQDGQVAL